MDSDRPVRPSAARYRKPDAGVKTGGNPWKIGLRLDSGAESRDTLCRSETGRWDTAHSAVPSGPKPAVRGVQRGWEFPPAGSVTLPGFGPGVPGWGGEPPDAIGRISRRGRRRGLSDRRGAWRRHPPAAPGRSPARIRSWKSPARGSRSAPPAGWSDRACGSAPRSFRR